MTISRQEAMSGLLAPSASRIGLKAWKRNMESDSWHKSRMKQPCQRNLASGHGRKGAHKKRVKGKCFRSNHVFWRPWDFHDTFGRPFLGFSSFFYQVARAQRTARSQRPTPWWSHWPGGRCPTNRTTGSQRTKCPATKKRSQWRRSMPRRWSPPGNNTMHPRYPVIRYTILCLYAHIIYIYIHSVYTVYYIYIYVSHRPSPPRHFCQRMLTAFSIGILKLKVQKWELRLRFSQVTQ